MSADSETRQLVREYVRTHPDVSSVSAVIGTLAPDVTPADAELVADVLDAEEPSRDTAGRSGETAENDDDRDKSLETGYAVPSGETVYPEALKARSWWVAWILDGVGRKRPVAPWLTGNAYPTKWKAGLDEDERPETEFETAMGWVDFPLADANLSLPDDAQSEELGLGIIIPRNRPELEQRVTLIDWDDVRDPETCELHPVAAEYIRRYGGYVEISQSGTGLHQFVFGGLPGNAKEFIRFIDDEPFIGDDRPQVELYDGGRHTAMTGRHVAGTGTDVLPFDDPNEGEGGQAYINDLVERFADAGNNSTDSPTTPMADGRSTDDTERETLSTEEVADLLEQAEQREYKGPDPSEWEIPDDRNLAYHAAVEAHYHGFAHVNFWRVTSAAAAHGQALGKSPDDVLDDLRGSHREGVSAGWGGKTEDRVRYDHERTRTCEFNPPSHARLAAWGILPPEYAESECDDADPVSALPLERLDALDADEARRYAKKHGVEWPTTDEARRRLRDRILTAVRHQEDVVLDAPTALGKSYTVATEPWLRHADVTDESPVIQFAETREARDQSFQASQDAGVDAVRLLGRSEACPVAAGRCDPAENEEDDDPDTVITLGGVAASEWFSAVCDGRGVPFSVAHRYLAEHNDQTADLPCEHGPEDEPSTCPAISQWEGVPRDDEGRAAVDVIHATHQFAHVPSLRSGTNMIFDERPGFGADLAHDRVRRAVTAYLRDAEAPVGTFEAMVTRARRDPDNRTANEHAKHDWMSDAFEHEPGREWYLEESDAHTLAPALAKAVWYALDDEEPDANGRYAATVPHEPPRLDAEANDDDGWNREWVSVVIDEDNEIQRVRAAPDLTTARCVVGLDAHPCIPLWQQNTKPGIKAEPVLGVEERALWRRYERGLLVVQVGEATRPLASGEYFDEDGTGVLLSHLRDKYGDRFRTAITASSVEQRTKQLMADAGVRDPETMHFGEEKSRNDFASEDVGLVNGSIDPGDEYVLNLLAEYGADATPATSTTDDGEEYREHGRGFDGPDAEIAAALLASVREQHVAQAAGRYARNADDEDDRAVVFVRTDATPSGFVDLHVPGVEWVATDAQRDVIEALQKRESATARELAQVADVTKEHVRQTLRRLERQSKVTVRENAGEHGAHLYRTLAGLSTIGCVRINETSNGAVWECYTWSLGVSPLQGAPELQTSPHYLRNKQSEASDSASDPIRTPPDT